ncbi:TetR/AcrR family transcriptional regulator [Bifidobacterium psychraerophilum]|jgi:AcrR family transcriptional regulator|uniref:TetR family transcriptional regulator n=1 Tax=Bifidobacterium psychraerophilum TaxID=218140 RepID=A0A087CJ33_9BIFI|nr:TetR/AcrR family transcriptional regulator [Bifidobacterium psychraerophilum]KFI83283.1 TetR family transcriptional regulator [Bifidobacterium psychraerophilum]PKA94338.1 TetR family transcriptional regulator [Bifidobacterium psychraerophilum DSM 22366]
MESRQQVRGKTAGEKSGPGTRKAAAAARREQIIAVSTRLISCHGFWGLSMRRVAEECNLTEPAVIYHFTSKAGLLIAVLEHRDRLDMQNFASTLGCSVEDVWGGRARFGLRDVCAALVQHNALQPEIVRLYTVLQGEALNANHPAHDYYMAREQRVLRQFTAAAAHDGIENPKEEALFVLSVMDGLQVRWLLNPDSVDLCSEWERFANERWGAKS